MWINRDISPAVVASHDPIQVFRGPRQCGKTSLVLHLDPSFAEISLDDPHLRELAQRDPSLLLKQFGEQSLFIDEAQYAPAIFPVLKRRADLYRRAQSGRAKTIIRITGSNQILMDKNVKESLAGRAAFFDLNTLSVREILHSQPLTRIQDIIFRGGWPELYSDSQRDARKYLDSYINSYVEKDIVLAAGIQKQLEFLKLAKLLAGRVGQLVDYSSIGNDAGVDAKTAKDWISVLERMQIIALVQPYSTNLSKRLIKAPKIYFIDAGLACRLQGWTASDPIFTSPQQGGLFENLVFSEIYKTNMNFQLGWQIFHWRSRDGEEIDFLVQQQPNQSIFIEVKLSPQGPPLLAEFPEIRKVFNGKLPPAFICHMEGDRELNSNVPIAMLADALIQTRH